MLQVAGAELSGQIWRRIMAKQLDSVEIWLIFWYTFGHSVVSGQYHTTVLMIPAELSMIRSQMKSMRIPLNPGVMTSFELRKATVISVELLLSLGGLPGLRVLNLSAAKWPIVAQSDTKRIVQVLCQALEGALKDVRALYLPVQGPKWLKSILSLVDWPESLEYIASPVRPERRDWMRAQAFPVFEPCIQFRTPGEGVPVGSLYRRRTPP